MRLFMLVAVAMCGTVQAALPKKVDTIVIGAGTTGLALVNRIITETNRSVLLIEAGPDFGSREGGKWPAEILDPTLMPLADYEWWYHNTGTGMPNLPLERGRMMGGCSSHNGAAAVLGPSADWEEWEAEGNPGWGVEEMKPYMRRAIADMQLQQPTVDEITPWHRMAIRAGAKVGLPHLADLNALDNTVGIAAQQVNILNRERWNMAFAYLDPIRGNERLTIADNTLVDRLVFKGNKVRAVQVVEKGSKTETRIETRDVIMAAGVFGTPLILKRSGVGHRDELAKHDIDLVMHHPHVGENLQDHPAYHVTYNGTQELVEMMDAFAAEGGLMREEGTTALTRSSLNAPDSPFDLHLYPDAARPHGDDANYSFMIATGVMTPISRGSIRLGGRDPEAQPIIDEGFLTDKEGHDLEALIEGIEQARELGRAMGPIIGKEVFPGEEYSTREALRKFVPSTTVSDYHICCSMKMGPKRKQGVVDTHGRMYGLKGVRIVDYSVAVKTPRANTNMPALIVALRLADFYLQDLRDSGAEFDA